MPQPKGKQNGPLALAGYRFRRRIDQPKMLMIEFATRDGDVHLAMSKMMLEQLVLDASKMIAKMSAAEPSLRALDLVDG